MKVVICGAGPVAALAGPYASKWGFEVELYELREGNSVPYSVGMLRLIVARAQTQGMKTLKSPGYGQVHKLDTTRTWSSSPTRLWRVRPSPRCPWTRGAGLLS